MPRAIVDGPTPTVEQIGWDELPLATVQWFANNGEDDAAAWLKANRKSLKYDESEARDDHGRWTSDGGSSSKEPPLIGGFGDTSDHAELQGQTVRGLHLTDDPHFVPDPNATPENNSTYLDRVLTEEQPHGIYTGNPEYWMHAHGYERPYVAEVQGTLDDRTGMSRSNEHFLTGDLKTSRVMTLDEYARQEYHEPGWVETYHDSSPYRAPYDSGNKPTIPNNYVARTVDQMSPSELAAYDARFAAYAARPDGPNPDAAAYERAMQAVRSLPKKSAKKWETVSLDDLKLRIEIEQAKAGTYDESQHPRDDHGRWTDSGDGGSSVATAERLPQGWSVRHGSARDLYVEMMTGRGLDQAITERLAKSEFPNNIPSTRYLSEDGNSVVSFYTDKVSPADQAKAVGTVDELLRSNPHSWGDRLDVAIVPAGSLDMNDGVFGLTVNSTMRINESVFGADDQKRYEREVNSMNFSPAGKNTDVATYTLTHEYGHVLGPDLFDKTVYPILRDNDAVPSRYGNPKKYSDHEAYAESFANWHLSTPEQRAALSPDSMTVQLAKAEGWK